MINLSKSDIPFRFCIIGLRNTLFIFGRKMVNCFVCFVCFVCLLQLCPSWLTLKKIEALIEIKKMTVRKKLFDVWLALGIAQPLRYSYSADLLDLQRCS